MVEGFERKGLSANEWKVTGVAKKKVLRLKRVMPKGYVQGRFIPS